MFKYDAFNDVIKNTTRMHVWHMSTLSFPLYEIGNKYLQEYQNLLKKGTPHAVSCTNHWYFSASHFTKPFDLIYLSETG